MYIDDFRDFDEEDTSFYDPNYVYNLETQDLPEQCPYRQMVPRPPFPPGPFGPGTPGMPGGQAPGAPMPPGAQGGPPSPPPGFTPAQPQAQQFGVTPYAVDPGAIRPCIYRFVFIWPKRGRGFWAWLTFVGRRSIAGFRWDGRTWRYFGMDLRQIRTFQCY